MYDLMAKLSYGGALVAIAAYLWTFTSYPQPHGAAYILLGVCAFLEFAPLVNTLRTRFGSNTLSTILPGRGKLLFFLVILLTGLNFFYSLNAMEFASPTKNGDSYSLSNHGETVRTLTETEYLQMKSHEKRLFLGHIWAFYFMSGLLWSRVSRSRP